MADRYQAPGESDNVATGALGIQADLLAIAAWFESELQRLPDTESVYVRAAKVAQLEDEVAEAVLTALRGRAPRVYGELRKERENLKRNFVDLPSRRRG